MAITSGYAQRTRQERIDSLKNVERESLYGVTDRRKRLDTLYRNAFVRSTVSAVLLPKGFVEINNAATLLMASRLFSDQGRVEYAYVRTTDFHNLLQLTYGVSVESRLNLGVDIRYSASRVELDQRAVLLSGVGADSVVSRSGGISMLGLRFRLRPLPRNRNLVLQGGLYLPGRQVNSSQINVHLQAIYVLDLTKTLFLYAQGGILYEMPRLKLAATVSLPAALVLQYQLRPFLGVFGVVGHNLTLVMQDNGKVGQTKISIPVGGGVQYQPSMRFGFSTFYTRYVWGRNEKAYDTVNAGIRVII